MELKVFDYVREKDSSFIYIITNIIDTTCYIKGLTIRLLKETNINNLIKVSSDDINKELQFEQYKINKFKKTIFNRSNKLLYGTILHIDGDSDYLESCMSLYKEMGLFANGICIKENDIKNHIENLLLELTPDIIVITGHDLYNGSDKKNISNYQNTPHFIDALRIIRKHFNQENVIVIIGACGSHFEALIGAGANFSSSPARINIHTYDPAIIAIKAATTSINQTIDFEQTLKFIENKHEAFGGIETKGKMKILL